jgi:cytochrome c biogenesis protein ResB
MIIMTWWLVFMAMIGVGSIFCITDEYLRETRPARLRRAAERRERRRLKRDAPRAFLLPKR